METEVERMIKIVKESDPASPDARIVEKLPAWVTRFRLLREKNDLWLYCEPGPSIDESLNSQFVLRVPAGRYLIDTFDAHSYACIARESAAGGPLVGALSPVGIPLLLRIRLVTQ